MESIMNEIIKNINVQLTNVPDKKEHKLRKLLGKILFVLLILYFLCLLSILTYINIKKQLNKNKYYESQTARLIFLNSKIDELTEYIIKNEENKEECQKFKDILIVERKTVVEELEKYF